MLHRTLAACPLVLLLIALGACPAEDDAEASDTGAASEGETPELEGLSLVEGGHTVVIDDSWKACAAVDDCKVVATSCDGCCGQDAVASSREAEYAVGSAALCEPYEGGACDCAFVPATLGCESNLCVLTPDE